MSWDWIDSAFTAAVGIAGIAGTWLTSKSGQTHAERVQTKQLQHERQLVADARNQARIEAAYLDVLKVAEEGGVWAQSVRPMMDTDPPQPVPPLPDVASQVAAGAKLRAFGSHEVQERFSAWSAAVKEVIKFVELIDLEAQDRASGRGNVDFAEPWRHLHEVRPKERETRDSLAERISAELRGESTRET